MKFLFKKKVSPQKDIPAQQNGIAALLEKRIKPVQRKWALWMQHSSEKLSLKTKWLLLVLFCLCSMMGCIYLVSGVFRANPMAGIKVDRIKSPVQLPALKSNKPAISEAEYQKFLAFKIYMDSLARSPDTERQYKQLLKQHPGLMDSLESVAQFYHSQFNP